MLISDNPDSRQSFLLLATKENISKLLFTEYVVVLYTYNNFYFLLIIFIQIPGLSGFFKYLMSFQFFFYLANLVVLFDTIPI